MLGQISCTGEGLEVYSVAPATGSAGGGSQVVVLGNDFTAGATVAVGGAACNSPQIVSSNEIDCTTSSHAPGLVDVVVQTTDGKSATLAQSYTYTCDQATAGLRVWANNGEDKVTRDDLRATCSQALVANSDWDGTTVKVFGAQNEVVAFNLVIESPAQATSGVSVSFNELDGPGGYKISSVPATGDGVFDWTNRNIELFYVRYLPIKGLSLLSYENYDERQIPQRFERPWTGNGNGIGNGVGTGLWTDRPDHDKFYPDIAVPIEVVPSFNIAADSNQSVWSDIYIPKDATPGVYTGTATVSQSGGSSIQVPVQLTVRNFKLPDVPTAKTMVNFGYIDQSMRYLGIQEPDNDPVKGPLLDKIRDRHFMMAHRHKISMVDANISWGPVWTQDSPQPVWGPRLDGSLFTAANGYDGPGVGVGNGVYAIGIYGSWSWINGTEQDMWDHTNNYEAWFEANSPSTQRFLCLADESSATYAQIEQWAEWMKANPGAGGKLASFAAGDFLAMMAQSPSVNIPAGLISIGDPATFDPEVALVKADPTKSLMFYNGKRPASGSFATEDDGVALRELAWGQYKMKIDRWFNWESTYYNNYQAGAGQTNVFENAATFGLSDTQDPVLGETGYLHSNGNGVLFYPGTDMLFPNESYGLDGPIASLRLKHWRRGIQDVDYLVLANAINPTKTQAIVSQMVPKAMWEVGVDNPADPTYLHAPISWSNKPDDWESARSQLADIIEGK